MLLYKFLPTNLVACKAAFYTFQLYIRSEVNTMRRCQELGQNVVFHKFARQIALIQCSGRSKHALPLHNKLKNWALCKTFSWREYKFHDVGNFQSYKSAPICGMQRNNGFLAKMLGKFPKSTFLQARSHFWQAPNLQCKLFRVWMNINRVTL